MNQNSGIVKTHSLNLDDDFHYLAKDPSQQPFRVYATRWLVLLAFSTFTYLHPIQHQVHQQSCLRPVLSNRPHRCLVLLRL